MNLKSWSRKPRRLTRPAVRLLLALAVIIGSTGSTTLAQDENQTDRVVALSLAESGVFSIDLVNDGNGSIARNTSATSPPSTVLDIKMSMNITDTKAYRPAFDIWMSATPFTSTVPVPNAVPNTFYTFPDDSLWIQSTRHPKPGRCDYPTTALPNECAGTPQHTVTTSYPIGNLWALNDNGLPVSPPHPTGGGEAALWTNGSNPAGNAANTLDVPRRVTHADAGTGTLDSQHSIYLGVTIPGAMPAGVYTTTIIITTVPPGL
jgi:hypothetical protein